MAEFPALPLWTDAYLGDTTHLTTIEHGTYLLLLMTSWRSKDCRLPDDDRLLARYARLGAGQWRRLRPVIEAFFDVADGWWVQSRLTDEAVAVRQKKDAAANAGRASALKRKGRHATERQRSVNGASTKGQPEANITSNHNQEEKTKAKALSKKTLDLDWRPEPFGEQTQSRVIVDGWPPDEAGRQIEAFRAHHAAHGNRLADWQQAWSTWVLNSVKFAQRPASRSSVEPMNFLEYKLQQRQREEQWAKEKQA